MEFIFIGGIITGLLMGVMCVYIGGHSKNDGSNKGEFTDNRISSISDVNRNGDRGSNNECSGQMDDEVDPEDVITVLRQIIFDYNLTRHEKDMLNVAINYCEFIEEEGDFF